VFPRADLQSQLLDKTMSMLPVALVLFAFASLWLLPDRALWASAVFGVGLLAVPVLSSYLSPGTATAVGAAVATVAGGLVLTSSRGWILSILAGALTTVFLTVEHGGLAAWLIAAVAICLVVVREGHRATSS